MKPAVSATRDADLHSASLRWRRLLEACSLYYKHLVLNGAHSLLNRPISLLTSSGSNHSEWDIQQRSHLPQTWEQVADPQGTVVSGSFGTPSIDKLGRW